MRDRPGITVLYRLVGVEEHVVIIQVECVASPFGVERT